MVDALAADSGPTDRTCPLLTVPLREFAGRDEMPRRPRSAPVILSIV